MSDQKKRIPAGELTAYERWELPSLGESTKRTAPAHRKQEVKPLTAADLERIREEAHREGFEQGKQEGYAAGVKSGHEEGVKQGREAGMAQGLEEGQAHIKQTQQQLTRLMQCLSEPLSEEQDKVAETMLNVSLAIARSVIRRELQSDSRVIQEVILEALSMLPRHSKHVVFRVNEADADYVRESLDAADSLAEVKVDAQVQAGGCLVDSATQQYDFTIEKRFQKLVHQMLMRASNEAHQHSKVSHASATMEERADFHGDVLVEAESEHQDSDVGEDDLQASATREAVSGLTSESTAEEETSNTSQPTATDPHAEHADSPPVDKHPDMSSSSESLSDDASAHRDADDDQSGDAGAESKDV